VVGGSGSEGWAGGWRRGWVWERVGTGWGDGGGGGAGGGGGGGKGANSNTTAQVAPWVGRESRREFKYEGASRALGHFRFRPFH